VPRNGVKKSIEKVAEEFACDCRAFDAKKVFEMDKEVKTPRNRVSGVATNAFVFGQAFARNIVRIRTGVVLGRKAAVIPKES
jgi:hypothetical protein